MWPILNNAYEDVFIIIIACWPVTRYVIYCLCLILYAMVIVGFI